MTAIEGELLPRRTTSGEALVSELESTGVEPCPAGPTARRPSRTPGRHRSAQVGTGRDEVAPVQIHHEPVVAAYRMYAVPRLEHRVSMTDHSLSDHRVALARAVIDLLDPSVGVARWPRSTMAGDVAGAPVPARRGVLGPSVRAPRSAGRPPAVCAPFTPSRPGLRPAKMLPCLIRTATTAVPSNRPSLRRPCHGRSGRCCGSASSSAWAAARTCA